MRLFTMFFYFKYLKESTAQPIKQKRYQKWLKMTNGRPQRRPFVFNLTFKNLTDCLYARVSKKVTFYEKKSEKNLFLKI